MMQTDENRFKNIRVEFHILQSFPVTCLNRDDVGAPKTAVVGGVTRARVSSQCWKRQVRLAMHEMGGTHGTRTKLIGKLIGDACLAEGATEPQAQACGTKIERIFIKSDSAESDKSDTLLFFSPGESKTLAKAFKEAGFDPDNVIKQKDAKKQAKELAERIGGVNTAMDALDIALFGRMVAQAARLNVEAAASFAHAISTHRAMNEVEFFTALDDLSDEPGSAHMGSLEFNSATYYRYISLDVGQLKRTLADESIARQAIDAFVKALYVAVPMARQATQSGASAWEFAKVLVRTGQRLQVPFEEPVRSKGEGFLKPSIDAMRDYLAKKEKLSGSLFGKLAEFTFGEDENYSIDNLVDDVLKAVEA